MCQVKLFNCSFLTILYHLFKTGSFACECNSGYFGDGFTCADVDECAENPCDSNAQCTNVSGGHTCSCNPGYSGDGVNCEDINECDADPCDANASCSNIAG